jgi:general L-amino acid transport system permease protein
MTAVPKMSRAVFLERLPGYVGQVVLLAVVGWLTWRGAANFRGNVRAMGLSAGFGFLDTQAGFQVGQALIAFGPASSYRDAIIVAVLNTLLVVALASLLSTLIALVIAFGRLAPAGLVQRLCALYVEVFRNIPVLLQILFWYSSALALLPGVSESVALGSILLNNRGLFLPSLHVAPSGAWALGVALTACVAAFVLARRNARSGPTEGLARRAWVAALLVALCSAILVLLVTPMQVERPRIEGFDVSGGFAILPELMALTLGLSIYNSTFLAEIFRAGILSVPRGQMEAATTVGLRGARAAFLITLPQALRVALPAAGGQYQTLAKASALAAAIGYPDIMQIVGGTVASQTGQALEAMALVVLLYGAINLCIALAIGVANRHLMRREGR